MACAIQTCSGKQACFQPRCGAACPSGCQ
jgi:hypothetical protein